MLGTKVASALEGLINPNQISLVSAKQYLGRYKVPDNTDEFISEDLDFKKCSKDH